MAELQSKDEGVGTAKDRHRLSFGIALSQLGRSVKNLAQSESVLARAELKNSMTQLGRNILQEGIFGTFLILSVLSFLSFLIIGLGRLLDNNFWLSSLILSLVLGLVGGGMVYRGFQKMKENDLTLPRTRQLFRRTKNSVGLKSHSQAESKIGGVA